MYKYIFVPSLLNLYFLHSFDKVVSKDMESFLSVVSRLPSMCVFITQEGPVLKQRVIH